jgi:Cu2+-exporting ATPase
VGAPALDEGSVAPDEGGVAADECAHCTLPLGVRPVVAAVDGARRRFCCYGCVLALQVTRARGDDGAAAAILVRLGLAVFFAINVMMVSMPSYVPYVYGTAVGTDGPLFQVLRVLAAVLAAPVLLLLGGPILASAWGSVRAGVVNADVLIFVGTLAAYVLSLANTIAHRPAVYFDTGSMLLVLVTLGRYLEANAKAEAGAAVRARLAPLPARATRVRGDVFEDVTPSALAVGDVVRVAPGEAFPTDGRVVAGTGGVDEAALTGESRPVLKAPGSDVAGGTCSIDGVLQVRVTAAAAASASARIAALLAAARRERASAERLADRITRALVPVVALIAVGSAVFWTARAGIDAGVLSALAVLVVACPCALGIATPVAVWTALVAAARHGVVVRSAAALERAASIDCVLFDKTGTLTLRMPRLAEVMPEGGVGASDLVRLAAALETGLQHPFARAIVDAWRDAGGAALPAVTEVRLVPGRGVHGRVEGRRMSIGDARLAAASLCQPSADALAYTAAEHDGGTILYVVREGTLLGRLRLVETLRPEAGEAIAALRRLDVRIGLVSGDRVASVVVPALVSRAETVLGVTPEEKLRHIRSRGGVVAMVGDGVNDAPALAAADLGIAVAGAADLARVNADVAVLADDLCRVPWFLAYARRVRTVIRQNLAWAFGYNAVAVALAAAGALTPLVASLAMIASSFAVIANARRLRLGI